MKKISPRSLLRVFLLIILPSVVFQPALAQKDILLYSSDFTRWGAVASSGSTDLITATGEGNGFQLYAKPQVKPASSAPDGSLGVICSENSSSYIQFPAYTFVSGGALEVEFYSSKNSKTLVLSGATITNSTIDVRPSSTETTKSSISGATFTSGKDFGHYKITFYFSTTNNQSVSLKLSSTAKCGEFDLTSFKVYSGVGTVAYVASTNYPQAPSGGLVMKGTIGGAAQSGTVVNSPINIKGWNIGSHDVKLTIIGNDAVKFLFVDNASNGFTLQPDGSLIVSNAKVASVAGTPIEVKFSPSVRAGISNALMKIEEIGGTSSPYIVSLTGLTGGTTPQILADTVTVAFWGSLISKNTKTINVAGFNLTGDVTLSITGADASKFSCSTLLIPKQTALNGTSVDITYTADISPSDSKAMLEIKSTGASTVYVPLVGYTSYEKPELLDLKFVVSPAGSGFVTASPMGPSYLKGSIVTAQVMPETGYSISYWSDAAGNQSSKRTFRVSDTKKGTITIVLVKNQGPVTGPSSSYVAYSPDESKGQITANGFLAQWTTLHDADEVTNPVIRYEVVVYDVNGTEISRVNAGIANNIQVTGLTQGTFYRYEVVAVKTDSTKKTTDRLGMIQTTTPPTIIICGE